MERTEFNAGIPLMHPRDCGKPQADFSVEELLQLPRTLTARELADPHSAYYGLEEEIPEELRLAMEAGPMDPAKAFMPHQVGEFMNNNGHCEVETGYCILPNGVSYAAALIRQDGITDEMVDYFNENFCLTDDLFYKTWCPGSHVKHFSDGCLEDFGWGLRNMRFRHPIKLTDLGLDYEKILENDPDCLYIGGSCTIGDNLSGLKAGVQDLDIIFKYHRRTPTGRELRVRLWYGVNINDGQYTLTMPPGGQPLEVARHTLNHVIREHCRDLFLIKKFWADTHL